jgi:hypothetical protein
MAEVMPSNPKGTGAGVGGAILGGVVGLIVAVILSLVGLGLSGAMWGDSPMQGAGACRNGIVTGSVLLAAAAGLGWLAWYMLFRNTSRGFGAGFLRGLSLVVALFLLIPWPCSYTGAAFSSFAACARRP